MNITTIYFVDRTEVSLIGLLSTCDRYLLKMEGQRLHVKRTFLLERQLTDIVTNLRFHLVVSFVFGYMFMAKISSSEVGFADLKNKGGQVA